MNSIDNMGDEEKIEIKIHGGKFKQFDFIQAASSFSDHYYYNRRCQKNYSDQWRNKISQEWDNFKVRLPDSIFVRANVQRPDLLRAVIVGPRGSPYHDGLFFFDIQFPSNYPDVRPRIHYWCYNVALMNDYIPYAISEFLKAKNIPWDSSTSTILQLLLSIHGTQVCRGKPLLYPNYPESCREEATLTFKERIFKGNWNTMVSVLGKPPKCFEEFVTQHFHDQAESIVTTCKAYIKGRVNTVGINVPTQEDFDEMESIYYKLVTAFHKNGSCLDNNLCKLAIEFHGKPAWSRCTNIIVGVAVCALGIFAVILTYFVIGIYRNKLNV